MCTTAPYYLAKELWTTCFKRHWGHRQVTTLKIECFFQGIIYIMEESKKRFESLIVKTNTRTSPGKTECWFLTTKPEKTTKYSIFQTIHVTGLGMTYGHQASYYFFKDQAYRPSRQAPISHLCEKLAEGEKTGAHRRCVNPEHLELSTIVKNIAERNNTYQREKQSGENGGNARFTNDEARAIQRRHIAGEEYVDIAASCDPPVCRKTIEKICIGATYPDLGDCRPIIAAAKEARNKAIVLEASQGVARKDLIVKYKVSGSFICGLIKNSMPSNTPITLLN